MAWEVTKPRVKFRGMQLLLVFPRVRFGGMMTSSFGSSANFGEYGPWCTII